MKFSSKTLLASLSLPILLSACTSSAENTNVITAQELQHHRWELSKIDGVNVTANPRNDRASLEIGEQMTANGNAGCNNFFGQGELKDDQFRIQKMGMTMKMCSEDAMKTELVVSQTLSEWADITLTKDSLTLRNDHHTLTYVLNDWKN